MSATSDVIICQAPDGQTQLQVQLQNDTVWLITQAQMAELFDTT